MKEVDKKYGERNLRNLRKFYVLFKNNNIWNAMRSKLIWTHYRELLRLNDISEINYAIMEASGKISFLPKSKYHPVTPSDMNLKVDRNSLCANLVLDGNIMENNLKEIGHDKSWLIKRLKKEGYEDIDKLLLVTCDSKEKLNIYLKEIELSNQVLE